MKHLYLLKCLRLYWDHHARTEKLGTNNSNKLYYFYADNCAEKVELGQIIKIHDKNTDKFFVTVLAGPAVSKHSATVHKQNLVKTAKLWDTHLRKQLSSYLKKLGLNIKIGTPDYVTVIGYHYNKHSSHDRKPYINTVHPYRFRLNNETFPISALKVGHTATVRTKLGIGHIIINRIGTVKATPETKKLARVTHIDSNGFRNKGIEHWFNTIYQHNIIDKQK